MREPDRTLEALLFLSNDPVTVPELAEAARCGEGEVVEGGLSDGDSDIPIPAGHLPHDFQNLRMSRSEQRPDVGASNCRRRRECVPL